MDSISLFEVFIAFLCFLFTFYYLVIKKPHDRFLRNWPVFGMLPGLLLVLDRLYEFIVEVLENSDLTFQFKGPWLSGTDMLLTVDPANIQYVTTSNFSNYNKGSDFKEVFDVFGDQMLTVDGDLWTSLRKSSQMMLNHNKFQRFTMSNTLSKIKKGLVPVLDHFAEKGTILDLQDVFGRFTFDTSLVMVTGFDPKSLTIQMPEVKFAKAVDVVGEGMPYRQIKPRILWKLQNWIGFGIEKKMSQANATFNQVCASYISAKKEEMRRSEGLDLDLDFDLDQSNEESLDLLASTLNLDATKYELFNPSDDKFLRDTIVGHVIASRDTTSSALTWFFWLLSQNPQVLSKIRQEININLPSGHQDRPRSYEDQMDYLNNLVYLHSAIHESMRLYPPVPVARVSPKKPDVLPSGHRVNSSSKILIAIYALARMRSVWGEDALEYKPERWITESGGLRHEPDFKFLVFNAGQRTCLGKHLATTLMKTVVIEMLQNYDIEVVNGDKIKPALGLTLRIKDGLKVKITKRS